MVSPMKGHDIGQGLSVLQVLRPAAGGMLRHVADLCDGMGRRGIRCTVAGPRGVLDALGVAVPNTVDAPISASANPVLDMRAVLRVARAARAHDLIHAHGLRGAWIGSWAALLVRRPMVMSAHNVPEARSVLRRFALTRSVRTAHTVVAVSEAVAAGLSKCGVPRERITVLPNGVAWRPAPDRDTLGERRLQLSVDAEAFMVAAAGRLSPEKGFDVLVAAAPAVVAGCSGAHIAICGAGPERERLETQIAALGMTNSVRLPGYVADLDRRLSVADVVVVPSRTEGQGLVALEAMALGVPVVASRVGGLPEVVEDQLTGLLVPPDDWEALADALLRLAMDPSLRARLGEAARLRVRERFSIETLLDRMAELYRATQNSLQGRMSPAG